MPPTSRGSRSGKFPRRTSHRSRTRSLRARSWRSLAEGAQPSARRNASSAYSISKSLTERPRRSASAASRSASSVGRTTVRRTQSSRSQTSSGVSDKLPPLGCNSNRRFRERDVVAKDAVAQEPETAQVREARSLRKAGDCGNVERRAQPRDPESEGEPPPDQRPRKGAPHPAACTPCGQPPETVGLQA